MPRLVQSCAIGGLGEQLGMAAGMNNVVADAGDMAGVGGRCKAERNATRVLSVVFPAM